MLKKILALLAGTVAPIAMAQSSEFIQAAMEGLKAQTSAHSRTWHLGEEKNWAADLDTGFISFTFADGTTATAPIQVVGTYNTTDGTFLWAWEHPSVPEPRRKHALLARQWGEANQVPNFTTSKVKCSESEAWTFAAVANRVANANGVYRGQAGTALVFMTLGEIKIAKNTPSSSIGDGAVATSPSSNSFQPTKLQFDEFRSVVNWVLRFAPPDWSKLKFTYSYYDDFAQIHTYAMSGTSTTWTAISHHGFEMHDFFDEYRSRTHPKMAKPWTAVIVVIDKESSTFSADFCFAKPKPSNPAMETDKMGC